MKYYIVVSGEIEEVVPILDYGIGPTETYKVCAYVKANNKEEAKKLALEDPEMLPWIKWQRDDNRKPFSGLKVEEISEEEYKEYSRE